MIKKILCIAKQESRTLTSKSSWAVRRRAFRIWQHRPHQVAPNDESMHTCQSCNTEFHGNYCPRCGQSANIGRFSFRTAILLFLDNWGIGNRSFFLTIRDLILRPGYLIRDYVRGRQSAYFPPFQMFFLLATFSLLVEQGLNLQPTHHSSYREEELPTELVVNGKHINSEALKKMKQVPDQIRNFNDANPALFSLLALMILSAPLFLFFRRCPAIPDLRFSEHLIALVYASNTYSIYQIISNLIPLDILSDILQFVALLMLFVALKQFTGYSKRRLLWYMVLTFFIFAFSVALIAAAVIGIIYYVYKP